MSAVATVLTKEMLIEFIRNLPDDITIADAIEELRIVAAIQDAQAEVAAGLTVSHEAACRRMESWVTKSPDSIDRDDHRIDILRVWHTSRQEPEL